MGPLAGGGACPPRRACRRKVWSGRTAAGTRASMTPACLQDRSRESAWLRDRLQTRTWLFPSYRHQTDLRRKRVVQTPGHRQPRSPGAGPRGRPARPTRPSRPGSCQGHRVMETTQEDRQGASLRALNSHICFHWDTWILNIPGTRACAPEWTRGNRSGRAGTHSKVTPGFGGNEWRFALRGKA